MDDQVATQLVAGLYNSDHQARVLSESASLPTLDDKLQRLLTLEKSEIASSSLSGQALTSNYAGGTRSRGRDNRSIDTRRRPPNPAPRGGRGEEIGTTGAWEMLAAGVMIHLTITATLVIIVMEVTMTIVQIVGGNTLNALCAVETTSVQRNVILAKVWVISRTVAHMPAMC